MKVSIHLVLSLLVFFLNVFGLSLPPSARADEPMPPKQARPVQTIPSSQVLTPFFLEVSYIKTVHLIFPSAIKYVDLGTTEIIAGKADGAQNVLRVKANKEGFTNETNLSVICEDGSFYNFNVVYAENPRQLNIQMTEHLYATRAVSARTDNDILLNELEGESPKEVLETLRYVFKRNRHEIRHIGIRKYNMQFEVRGLYYSNGMYYFNMELKNRSHVAYRVDYISFKIIDKKTLKRTASQEQTLVPIRTFNDVRLVAGSSGTNLVYAFKQFTMPDDKELEITLLEEGGGRVLTLYMTNEDLINAKSLNEYQIRKMK